MPRPVVAVPKQPKVEPRPVAKPTPKPVIEYDYFETKVLRIVFEGGKHFIFQGTELFRIKEGMILVLQKDAQNLMAVQVQNGESTSKTFSAKVVKTYVKNADLVLGESYTAVARGLRSDPDKDIGRILLELNGGYSNVAYTETFSADFTESLLNFGGKATYVYSKEWRFFSKAGFLLLPLKSSPESFTARFMWLEAGGSFKSPKFKKPWELSLVPSFRYLTSFVTTDSFGYQGLMGPQVGVKGGYDFASGQSVSLETRFALLTASSFSVGFGKREWGISGTLALAPWDGRRWSVGVDYSSMSFVVGEIALAARNMSAGLSYSW